MRSPVKMLVSIVLRFSNSRAVFTSGEVNTFTAQTTNIRPLTSRVTKRKENIRHSVCIKQAWIKGMRPFRRVLYHPSQCWFARIFKSRDMTGVHAISKHIPKQYLKNRYLVICMAKNSCKQFDSADRNLKSFEIHVRGHVEFYEYW
jgi:hypothetical protein